MEDRKKKIIILASIIVVILIVAAILVIKLITINKDNNDDTIEVNSSEIINNTVQENILENNEINNEVDNTVNEIIPEKNESAVNENITQNTPIADAQQEVDKETIEKYESDREKAIRIAKEDWGEDSTVSFDVENSKDNQGRHIVNVRDEARRVIAIYKIDINTGNFIKEQ